jgi:NADPH2:quinone reductase
MSIPATMRALQQTSFDGPQDMRLITDAPVPSPRAGEVLIRVAAAGVNFADIARAQGTFLGGPRPPYLAGFEAAGEVVPDGRRVVGVGDGAFAEYMVLNTAMPVPEGWSAHESVGLAVNWPTAIAALKLGRLAPGETVLIGAAAGATGQAAVRLAKHYGATVLAAASPAKHDAVRSLGADHVLDSRGEDLAAQVLELTGGVDLVLESTSLATGLAVAKRVTGRVVVYGTAGGEATVSNVELVYRHQVQLIGLNIGVVLQTAAEPVMGELAALLAAGVIPPGRPTVYDLADGPKALADLASRVTVGKLSLRP